MPWLHWCTFSEEAQRSTPTLKTATEAALALLGFALTCNCRKLVIAEDKEVFHGVAPLLFFIPPKRKRDTSRRRAVLPESNNKSSFVTAYVALSFLLVHVIPEMQVFYPSTIVNHLKCMAIEPLWLKS